MYTGGGGIPINNAPKYCAHNTMKLDYQKRKNYDW